MGAIELAPRDRPYFVECDSTDEAWHRYRRTGIGASEIAAVLGESPWTSPLALYAEKLGRLERDYSDNEAVYWGNKLEGPIVEAYSERTGRQTRRSCKLLRSSVHPWALCTLDAETWITGAEPWPLEIKNAASFKADEWEDGPPPHYYFQIQQQMLVTGAHVATIAALLGGQRMVWADVPRDEVTIRKIIFHGDRFWERVMRRDVPPPDGSDSTKRALAALYPTGSGMIVLPGSVRDVADELEALKAQRAQIGKQIDAIENAVKAALGDAETGVMHDGRSFVWSNQKRAGYTVEPTEYRVLRLKQPKRGKEPKCLAP